MFFTGDSDTRVDPLHARKMTALLQAASSSGRPILLHYSVAGGHSSGVSVEQQIQDDTDELTFLWTETGQATDKVTVAWPRGRRHAVHDRQMPVRNLMALCLPRSDKRDTQELR